MTHHRKRRALAVLPIAVVASLVLVAALAGAVLAESGGMSGMEGMSAEEMQNMGSGATPTPAPTAMNGDSMSATGDAHTGDAASAVDPHMDMGGGSVNWFVIGGFIVLIVGSTLGAVATKRYLSRRMAAGELAGAGARGV